MLFDMNKLIQIRFRKHNKNTNTYDCHVRNYKFYI